MIFLRTRFFPTSVAVMIPLFLFFFCYEDSVCGADPEIFQSKAPGKSANEKTVKKTWESRLVVYSPPKRGKPGGRIGGGTRGKGSVFPVVSVLTPDHTGLTTKAQPELYCYVSNPTNKPIEFSLNLEQEGKTIAHKAINGIPEEGILRLSLSDLGVELSPDMEYTWFVTMVIDPDQPSTDVFSGGSIMRVHPSGTIEKKLKGANEMEVPAIYAEEGIWYEALSSLSRLIEEDPGNKALRMQRANLLEQVQLEREAVPDRKAAERDDSS